MNASPIMTNREHNAHMNRFERLREILADVQMERIYRPIETGQDGWIAYEKLHMWGAVNRMRINLMNKEPIPFERVVVMEAHAAGHSDYSKKFALYCAELLLDD